MTKDSVSSNDDRGDRRMTRLHFNLRRIPADGEPDHAVGPGWFDSSWDLVHGLEVRECLPADSGFAAECNEQPGTGLVPAAAHRAFGDTVQFGDLGLAVAAEVAHLDQFSQIGIDGLEFA